MTLSRHQLHATPRVGLRAAEAQGGLIHMIIYVQLFVLFVRSLVQLTAWGAPGGVDGRHGAAPLPGNAPRKPQLPQRRPSALRVRTPRM
jgi:hypothetical protein